MLFDFGSEHPDDRACPTASPCRVVTCKMVADGGSGSVSADAVDIGEEVNITAFVASIAPMVTHASGRMSRVVTLGDDSGVTVTLKLWNDDAEEVKFRVGSIIEVCGAAIDDFTGKWVLKLSDLSTINVQPTNDAAKRLLKWATSKQMAAASYAPSGASPPRSGGDGGGGSAGSLGLGSSGESTFSPTSM